ncbi:hypothetical protein KAM461_29640 [Aeromonas hydrophila]|nr:hypothetical protein KAM461_29640 [Aeromonas hydrophila]
MDVVSLAKARTYINSRIQSELSEVRQTLKKRNTKGINKIARYRDIGSQTTTGLLSGPQLSESKDDVPIQPKTTPPQLEDDWDSFTSGLEPY